MQRLFYGPRDGVSPLECLDLSLWSGVLYRHLLSCVCELWDMRGTLKAGAAVVAWQKHRIRAFPLGETVRELGS